MEILAGIDILPFFSFFYGVAGDEGVNLCLTSALLVVAFFCVLLFICEDFRGKV